MTLIEMYNEMLDGCFEECKIGSLTFSPSRVLSELDPIAYNYGYSDWLDSIEIDCSVCGISHNAYGTDLDEDDDPADFICDECKEKEDENE